MRRFRLLLVPLLVLATGVGSATEAARFKRNLSRAEVRKCVKLGGQVQRIGMLQAQACVLSFPDAGKACTDGSECLGDRCYWNKPDTGQWRPAPPPDQPVVGQCAATNNPFGCYDLVSKGRYGGGGCLD